MTDPQDPEGEIGLFPPPNPPVKLTTTTTEVAHRSTTTTTVPPELGPVTTIVAETTPPATLPFTGAADYHPELFSIATVMLLAGVTLASRKEKR